MAKYQFTVVIEQDEDGVYISSCPALQGCHSQGDTYEEAIENLKDALQVYLEAKLSLGETIPAEVGIDRVEVNVEIAPGKTA
jgi:predicted RNase H-like HicB family nuclease